MNWRVCFAAWISIILVATAVAALPPQTDPQTKIIALSGDGAPGGGRYLWFYEPVMNNQGQVAFTAALEGISAGTPTGVFRFDGDHITAIAGPGVVDGTLSVQSAGEPSINESGQAAFLGSNAVLRASGGPYTLIARRGQAAPGGRTIAYLPIRPGINDLGQVAVPVSFSATTGVTGGVYRGSGGALTEIARLERPAPTGGNYTQFHYAFPINNAGNVAFAATTSIPNSGAIFLGNGSTTMKIVQQGDLAPAGDGVFGDMGHRTPALNDAGDVAFFGRVDLFTSPTSYSGVFLNSANELKQIVRTGEPTPSGDANVYSIAYGPVINNQGQTAFVAFLRKPENPLDSLAAVYRGDASRLTEVMREGSIASDGNGRFLDFGNPEINGNGQIAVMAALGDTSGGKADDQGLYFYSDASGLVQVARKGQPMLGSSIEFLNFTGGLNHVETIGDEAMGMNDLGHVAYAFRLADGRQGIAVWQIPEPSSIMLLATVAVVWPLRRRTR